MFSKIWEILKRTNRFDPLGTFCQGVFWGIPSLASVAIGVVMVAGWWGMGEYSKNIDPPPTPEVICSTYPQIDCPENLTIVYHTNYAEYSFALFLWGVFVPVIWWFYLSIHRMWNKLLQSLAREDIVDSRKLNDAVQPILDGSFWLPSLLIAIFVMVLYIKGSIPSEIELGRASFWILTLLGKAVVTVYVGLNTFVLVSFALRTLILIMITAHFFTTTGIKDIHIFHIDRCGGFGAVGILATQLSSLAVLVGFWAVWYSVLPMLSGGQMNFGITVILLYCAYAILVPLILISLTSPVGTAMKRYKQRLLMQVSKLLHDEMELLVNKAKSGDIDNLFGQAKTQENRYQNLQQLYEKLSLIPESPIRLVNLKRFTGFAVFPALFGSISFILSVLDLYSELSKLINN